MFRASLSFLPVMMQHGPHGACGGQTPYRPVRYRQGVMRGACNHVPACPQAGAGAEYENRRRERPDRLFLPLFSSRGA
ncbi:hypothetical protein GXY_14587 [Novacetimonas hansenii ATCC 23769]|uniref:Uncharacterized protein n=1 Tax=Novacetimonas hansenii ATCC 23769 TaxID=714995 RepID=D5QID6_NOVHA|nr:hypothetical protein GXY_14587 [Novacetimonas hansenii ATCC 23769]